ncbi:hypothetical protein VCHA49P379_210032 [Vibrio chagasii]|nr:hypothetical protein VCHA49P379_210032 [Vibrio chagasii]
MFLLFVSRIPFTRICPLDHKISFPPLGIFHFAPTYSLTPCQSWQLSN